MKIKKILKLLMPGETVRIWGNSDRAYLFHGSKEEVPLYLAEMKAQESPDDGYINVRSDGEDDFYIALFVDEEEG